MTYLPLDHLYREFAIKYHAWANSPRIDDVRDPDDDSCSVSFEELRIMQSHREKTWKEYVLARDIYLRVIAELNSH